MSVTGKRGPQSRPAMDADEIRDYHWGSEGQILTEIAAQLSEMNEHLKVLADAAYADGMARHGG